MYLLVGGSNQKSWSSWVENNIFEGMCKVNILLFLLKFFISFALLLLHTTLDSFFQPLIIHRIITMLDLNTIIRIEQCSPRSQIYSWVIIVLTQKKYCYLRKNPHCSENVVGVSVLFLHVVKCSCRHLTVRWFGKLSSSILASFLPLGLSLLLSFLEVLGRSLCEVLAIFII